MEIITLTNIFTLLSRSCLLVLFLALVGCQTKQQTPEVAPPIISGPIEASKIEMPVAPVDKNQPKVKVAVLLPLSGENHILGNELLNSAQMSMFENKGDNIEMIVLDTKGDPSTASSMAQSAISQGAKMIVGPVYSTEATAVKPIAQNSGVPVISLSNNQEVAAAPVFTFGFGPKDQIWKLMQVAKLNGLKNIGAFVPKSPHGQMIKSELERAAQSMGMPTPFVLEFDNTTTDFTKFAKDFKASKVDGIVIPEGGQKLRLIVSGLLYGDLKGVKFMGTGQWDTPDINFDSTLIGGWFVASPMEPRVNFNKRYEAIYSKTPQRIATLAYDAISLAIKAADSRSGMINYGLLTDQRGFSGVDGVFKLLPNGQVERDLSVYEITESGLKKVG